MYDISVSLLLSLSLSFVKWAKKMFQICITWKIDNRAVRNAGIERMREREKEREREREYRRCMRVILLWSECQHVVLVISIEYTHHSGDWGVWFDLPTLLSTRRYCAALATCWTCAAGRSLTQALAQTGCCQSKLHATFYFVQGAWCKVQADCACCVARMLQLVRMRHQSNAAPLPLPLPLLAATSCSSFSVKLKMRNFQIAAQNICGNIHTFTTQTGAGTGTGIVAMWWQAWWCINEQPAGCC